MKLKSRMAALGTALMVVALSALLAGCLFPPEPFPPGPGPAPFGPGPGPGPRPPFPPR